MTSILEYFRHAELALASYADFGDGRATQEQLRDAGMSPIQAARFAEQWRVVETVTDSSGLQATLFQHATTGQLSLAIRGTTIGITDPADAVTDSLIVTTGFERSQTLALVNWFLRLRAPVTELVPQYAYFAPQLDGSGSVLSPGGVQIATLATGLDRIPAGAQVTVTGHSLGGYLALVFTHIFPDAVVATYTYNRLGYRDSAEFRRFVQELGGSAPLAPEVAARIVNVAADAGLDGAVSIGESAGANVRIFSEDGPGPSPIHNHRIVNLTDAVALYALFTAMDPSVTPPSFMAIAKALSSLQKDTLETGINALYKLFLGADGGVMAGDREAFYTRYYELADHIQGLGISGLQVKSIQADAGFLAALARSDVAYRYALKELNPFVIFGASYGAHNAGGRLELYDPNTGEGELTEEYLTDRAKMLAWVIKYNTRDGMLTENIAGDVEWVFEDRAKDIRIVLPPKGFIGGTQSRLVFGDDSADDILSGGNLTDRFYGGGGTDTLAGGGGADYLEGQSGSDRLEGGAGNDILVGGSGDDTLLGGEQNDVLVGGAGDDILEGGAGLDTYVVGMGNDTISDTDGVGLVKDDHGRIIAGLFVKSGDTYVWAVDSAVTAKRTAGLAVQPKADSAFVIQDWQDGELGIRLSEDPITPVEVVLGDQDPDYLLAGDYLAGVPDVNVGYHWRAGQGDDFVNPQSLAGDLIEGNAGSDILVGGNGDDEVFGGERAELAAFIAESRTAQPTGERGDWVSGGLGDDIVAGAHGNDVIFGGGGADLLIGGAGDDVIDGDDNYLPADVEVTVASDIAERFYNAPFFDWSVDASDPFDAVFSPVVVFSRAREEGGADVIYAGAGDDIAYGLVGDDILYGEDGNDRLSGGIGDDDLWGAAEKIHRGMVAGNDCEMRRAA